MQPLFPGESGVDQLVEIVKVRLSIRFIFASVDASFYTSYSFLGESDVISGFGNPNKRRGQVHESKLH